VNSVVPFVVSPDGVTPNDSQGHVGPNNWQNYPVLAAASSSGTDTIITGTYSSGSVNNQPFEPGKTFTLDFYANLAPDPTGYGQGQTWLGFAKVTTDANGYLASSPDGSAVITNPDTANATFTADLPAGNLAGQGITATATDSFGNTSEFCRDKQALPSSSLSGFVFEDFNENGQFDFGDKGISGVTITLTGTDFLGNAVNPPPQLTDGDGSYRFLNLLPGSYYITETPPAGYLQGIDAIGTAGGSLVAPGQFSVPLAAGVDGLNYNFGELPTSTGPVQKGQTAGIGFWNNKNGQALIKALNGGAGAELADWLAATLPNIFGKNAANDVAGQSNAYIAALFQQDFLEKGVKLDAQLLATALSVYATNATLDPTHLAATYGFTVSSDGAGTATANVGRNGDAFDVANNTTMTLMDLLLAADAQAVNGVLYNGNGTKRNEANAVFSAVNQDGGIG
jgi:hypothetical protein